MRKLALIGLLVMIGACAPKRVPVPVVTVPKFPDFLQPVVPAAFDRTPAAVSQSRGWAFLQAGDLKNAEREFGAALKSAAAFYPAETALAYVELARKDAKAALPRFDRALGLQRDYVPALVGRGQTLLALNREADALVAFEMAVAADSSLTDLKQRIEVLKFRSLEQNLAGARQAARAGRLDDAVRGYNSALASSPDSPFLYRELAAVERQKGELDRAIEHFRHAVTLEPTDASSLVQIGDILDGRGDLDGAAAAYSEALKIEPNDAVEAKLEQVQARAELARLPGEYRAIDHAAQVTRADLAALIGVRLAPLLQAGRRRDAVLVTDVRNNWAVSWILAVARAGIMDPYANRAFQPRTIVRRIDLAQVVSRLLARIAVTAPAQAKSWQASRLKFSDLPTSHLAYLAASEAVASNVMTMGSANSFQPSRPVSGAEAVDVIGRIAAIAGPARTKGTRRR